MGLWRDAGNRHPVDLSQRLADASTWRMVFVFELVHLIDEVWARLRLGCALEKSRLFDMTGPQAP